LRIVEDWEPESIARGDDSGASESEAIEENIRGVYDEWGDGMCT
jgi:hypothetical protein